MVRAQSRSTQFVSAASAYKRLIGHALLSLVQQSTAFMYGGCKTSTAGAINRTFTLICKRGFNWPCAAFRQPGLSHNGLSTAPIGHRMGLATSRRRRKVQAHMGHHLRDYRSRDKHGRYYRDSIIWSRVYLDETFTLADLAIEDKKEKDFGVISGRVKGLFLYLTLVRDMLV